MGYRTKQVAVKPSLSYEDAAEALPRHQLPSHTLWSRGRIQERPQDLVIVLIRLQ